MDKYIILIVSVVVSINILYTIKSYIYAIVRLKNNKIYFIAPMCVLLFGVGVLVTGCMNLYYFILDKDIVNILSVGMCIPLANQIFLESFFLKVGDSIYLKNQLIPISQIQNIESKRVFVIGILELIIIKRIEETPISVLVSKKGKKCFFELNH